MEDFVITITFDGLPINHNDPWKLWDNDRTLQPKNMEDRMRAYYVSGSIVDWFNDNNIVLRYNYVLPTELDKEEGILAKGIDFRFDESKYALLFKLRWI